MKLLTHTAPLVFFLAGIASGTLISLVLVQHYGIFVAILASSVVLAFVIALSVGIANSNGSSRWP